jgi:hypothetical protein
MEVDEEEEDDEDDQEENEADEDEEGEGQDEPIEEEDDDVIVIDDEDDIIKVEPKQEVQREGSMEIIETPQGNEATPRVETLEEMLQKANAKAQKANAKVYHKWMAGIERNQIGPKLEEMDTLSVLKMVQVADQEIKQHPAKLFEYLLTFFL